jgi:hypothetical protein
MCVIFLVGGLERIQLFFFPGLDFIFFLGRFFSAITFICFDALQVKQHV